MRNTLLTTTALVLSAGIASADGHASLSWSGTATAGVARTGETAAVAAKASTNFSALQTAVVATAFSGYAAGTKATALSVQRRVVLKAKVNVNGSSIVYTTTVGADGAADATAAVIATDVAGIRLELKNDGLALAALGDSGSVANKAIALANALTLETLTSVFGLAVAATKTGDFETYSEVNATVTGSVTAGATTVTASMSVDAGKGYDFADDDGFDAATAGRVALDNITIASAIGTFKIDENAVAHLVDAGDDATADVLYTNTFGTMSFSAAVDVSKDTDATARKATAGTWAATAGVTAANNPGSEAYTVGLTAVAADVSWSAKLSMPLGSGSAYIAMDEEGGNIFGASATLGGVGLTFSSKLEALEEELSIDRDNSIGATYVMGATTLGATWNSVEDKDQWGISAAYSADGMTLNASTDEGSDWAVSGSYLMGTGASVVGGVNYTEDAYLGLSFSF